jgi:hypothetical protein
MGCGAGSGPATGSSWCGTSISSSSCCCCGKGGREPARARGVSDPARRVNHRAKPSPPRSAQVPRPARGARRRDRGGWAIEQVKQGGARTSRGGGVIIVMGSSSLRTREGRPPGSGGGGGRRRGEEEEEGVGGRGRMRGGRGGKLLMRRGRGEQRSVACCRRAIWGFCWVQQGKHGSRSVLPVWVWES